MSEYISIEQYNTYLIKSIAKNVYFPTTNQELMKIVNN
ncbi:UDP-N-acetylmuramate dehydrogenase, partial [Francisella tularensis subsp. holarctica]|nr:UDP-N-acetylmuramate dehydrogenase [Francisella tularensis subsp. holarctica]